MALSTTLKAHIADPRNYQHLCTLIEIDYYSDTYGLATRLYTGGSIPYDSMLTSDVIIEGNLDSATTVGDVTFYDDVLGSFWRDNNFSRRETRFYVGDTRWERSQFEQLTVQWIDRIVCLRQNEYRIEWREVPQSLDVAINSIEINGIQTPQSYGYVYNATPVLVDAANLKYRIDYVSTLLGVVVRDNGVPLTLGTGYTLNVNKTEITLLALPAGEITADYYVSGKTSMHKVMLDLLVQAGIFFTEAELLARMRGFYLSTDKTAFTVGYYCREPKTETFKGIIDGILSDLQMVMRTADDGLPEIVYLDWTKCQYFTAAATINEDVIIDGTLSEIETLPSYSNLRMGYRKNWTQQTSFAGSVTLASRDLYSRDNMETYTRTGLASEPDYTDGDYTLDAPYIADATTAAKVAENIAYRHSDYPRRRVWGVDAVGVAYLRVADAVTIDHPAVNATTGNRYFVRHVKHNLTSFLSSLELMEGNRGV